MFDLSHAITLFCSFSFFFCCQTSYARVIMDRSRPTRVAKKIPPSDCRVIPLESSVMGHVWRYLLFQYVANTKNVKCKTFYFYPVFIRYSSYKSNLIIMIPDNCSKKRSFCSSSICLLISFCKWLPCSGKIYYDTQLYIAKILFKLNCTNDIWSMAYLTCCTATASGCSAKGSPTSVKLQLW